MPNPTKVEEAIFELADELGRPFDDALVGCLNALAYEIEARILNQIQVCHCESCSEYRSDY